MKLPMVEQLLRCWLVQTLCVAVLVSAVASNAAAQAKPKFDSKLVTSKTKGHAVAVDVDIKGAKQLYLVVTDGGNGIACDWADWAEPRLVAADGKEKKLTELKWKSAKADWGQVRINNSAGGGSLQINGKPVEYGIGTHANSVIVFDLPPGYTRFKARAGLDNGGTNQAGGASTSVRFLVFTEKPPATLLAHGGGGQDAGKREAVDALAGLDVHKEVEATLFAAEPQMLSPSNIDIDSRGRVWVCEVTNYRHRRNTRKEGDRILILEDTDGNGKADKRTVFYQGRDIDSAHGICVLETPSGKGTRVIVSVGAGVYIFTDKDGDLKSDEKKPFFTGISGTQHDHGIHAFIFGPDGKLYFNFGNEGKQIKDAKGQPIKDLAGNEVNDRRQPYQQGMVFRCNLDGSEFETLGWNFRNNWEVTVDSFGTLWQSDNDDDGNRGVRINYVMEFGNYGYRDEFSGAGWRSPRVGMHEEIPKRHWHLRDPGVVPNLLQTGAGSPTGICVYEGTLLPKVFRNQVIHCDAGPNVVRAYPVTNDGAGYKAEMVNILEGARDKWFRPSDVCVAPDGSLLVADWYDPGVGGHRMGDVDRGRIFRVAPPKAAYRVPKYDYTTPKGAIEALKNPNLAVRQLAWTALHEMQAQAEQPLAEVFRTSDDQRLRARMLWLLSKIQVCGKEYVEEGLTDKNSDIRITALRAARQLKLDVIPYIKQLVRDKSPQVRRECLIALRHHKSKEAPALWADLAERHDGKDRWYLEALGIAADKQWDRFLDVWGNRVAGFSPAVSRDIWWRSRGKETARMLVLILKNPEAFKDNTARYLRAFDFLSGPEKDEALLELAFSDSLGPPKRQTLINREAIARLGNVDINKKPNLAKALNAVLDRSRGTSTFVDLVAKFNVAKRYPELLAMAQKDPDGQVGVEAIRALLAKNQTQVIQSGLYNKDQGLAAATARVLGYSADGRIVGLLRPILNNPKEPAEVRRQAARSMAKTRNGARQIVELAKAGKLDDSLKKAVAFELHLARWNEVKSAAAKLFPLPAVKNQKLPPIAQLVKMRGDVGRGTKLFAKAAQCAKCHKVGGEGKDVGPDLTEIGGKLSREAFFESILYPSAGISHNYESHILQTADGNSVTGIITSQTPATVTVVSDDGISRKFKKSNIERMVKSKISMMPADLQKLMSTQDLVDVVEYLQTLKKGKK